MMKVGCIELGFHRLLEDFGQQLACAVLGLDRDVQRLGKQSIEIIAIEQASTGSSVRIALGNGIASSKCDGTAATRSNSTS